MRIARPVSDLSRSARLYTEGLGLQLLGSFEAHDGFDGVMVGEPGAGYHFEFTQAREHPVRPSPTVEDLIVFYIEPAGLWSAACARMLSAGFRQVPSFNPYWNAGGCTFEDSDGYRVVLHRSTWP
jgi:catechol 2,3-dioxygenase-like lactoylglutathione lyase family enzyme